MTKRHCTFKSARFVGDPVDVVTGTVVGVDREFQLPGPFEILWRRYYDSRRYLQDAGCGLGFRFEYDRRLRFDLDGIRYIAPDESEARMPELDRDGDEWLGQGFRLLRIDALRYELTGGDRVAMHFAFDDPTQPAKLLRLATPEHAVSFGYDERGRLVTLADARGRSIRVMRDSLGRMQRVLLTDPEHGLNDKPAAEYAYDDAGRLTRTTDPYGHHLAYAYDKQGRLARFSDRNGYSFHYAYDAHGRCIHTHGDDGIEELRLVYDRDARFTTVTRGNGGQWQYFYDENDALTRVIDPIGAVTEYQYEIDGTLVREIRPDKTIITYEHDETGFNNVNALPTGEGVEPGAELDPLDVYERRYRIARAPVTAHTPHGFTPATALQWELGGLIDEPYSLPLQNTRPRHLTAAEHATLVLGKQAGAGTPREVRDAFGLLVRVERDDGPARQFHYDPNGNPARITDFDGGQTRYQLSSWNHVVANADALGQGSAYAHDRDENVTAIQDAGGSRTDLKYDLRRNVTELHRNGRLRERHAYDFASKPVERIAGDGRVLLRFKYDSEGLLASRTLASGEEQSFEYGNLGALAKCKSDAGSVELQPTIDGGTQQADLRDGKGVTHELTWGGVDKTHVLEHFELQYYQYKDGTTQMVVAPGERVHRVRLCGSGVTRREYADGARETVQYDPRGRVLARLRADKNGKLHDTHYRYSGEGDLLQVVDSERGLTRYEYDAAHRLVRVQPPGNAPAEDYAYDAAGNLIQKPGITYFGDLHLGAKPPDGPAPPAPATDHGIWLQNGNRLYRVHDDYFVYDARDHLQERRGPRGSTRYRYDALDRLVAIERPDGVPWSAKYDALGRRTEKTFGSKTWIYYWSGDRLAAEILPDKKLRIYLYADRDEALVPFGFVDFDGVDADPKSGKHYRIEANHLGTPERVIDEQGTVVWEAELEAFGAAKITVGEDFHQPLRMPGHYCDAETGLHYNRYRYYSPELGRYLQSDPIDLEGGHNLYAYAQDGNPLRDVDVFGLACQKAEKILEASLESGLIDKDGNPGKPFSKMSAEEKQAFCVARAAQLENGMHPEAAKRTTVCVSLMKGKNGRTKVVVTTSGDSGTVPKSVRKNMRDGEEPRNTPPKLKGSHKGEEHPGAAAARKKEGNRDGKVMKVDPKTDKATPVQKKNKNNPDGTSEHHAEQRAESAAKPGETVEAIGPSKPCCEGCQKALGPRSGLKKVHPDMRGT